MPDKDMLDKDVQRRSGCLPLEMEVAFLRGRTTALLNIMVSMVEALSERGVATKKK